MSPRRLEEVPHFDVDGDGQGEWHENAEIRRLIRPMTPEEAEDFTSYDRSLYRMREASHARLLAMYGEVWMLAPKPRNRNRHWLPPSLYGLGITR